MSENLRHWSVLGKTDPKHTKPFQRAGGFRGTATRPVWNEMRLTEHFGPCGVGWGCDEPKFTLVPTEGELLVYCVLSCWYRDGEATATVWGVGGDKVRAVYRSGPTNDDEAFKKAFTDALGNAFKHVGMNADIHMGLFEDSKYQDDMRREFAEDTPPATPTASTSSAPLPHRDDTLNDTDRRIAEAAYKRIRSAIRMAKTPTIVDQIIEINKADIAVIKQVSEHGYDEVMAMAVARTNELRASA